MTVELYKRQAARLSEHLSSVHKVRLKHASALEAIAAIHECHDWNTLVAAGVQPNTTPGASPTLRNQNTLSREQGNAYLFSRHDFADPQFCDALLTQSVAIRRGFPGESQAIVDHLLDRQIQRGGGVLFLTAGSPVERARLNRAMTHARRQDQIQIVSLLDRTLPSAFNPLCVTDANALANIILQLLPSVEVNAGADFYRQSANYAMTVILGALLKLNEEITFHRLLEVLGRPETELLGLLERLPESSPERSALELFLSHYLRKTKSGETLDSAAFRSNAVGGLVGRIAMLSQGFIGEVFNPKGPGFSWKQPFTDGKCVYLETGAMASTGSLEAVVLSSLRAYLEVEQLLPPTVPVTVFADKHMSGYMSSGLIQTLGARGIGLVLTEMTGGVVDANIEIAIGSAGGFGRSAQVNLTEVATGHTATAELREFSGWPA